MGTNKEVQRRKVRAHEQDRAVRDPQTKSAEAQTQWREERDRLRKQQDVCPSVLAGMT